jgi:LDH2 family malate/lactate/ureidoglycolate dehydrogenase
MCEEVKKESPQILFPGEPEIIAERRRSQDGIPVEDTLIRELDAWADRLGIPLFSSL